MKALFLIGETLTDFGGISKKIIAQVNALKNVGIDVTLSYLKANHENTLIARYAGEKKIDNFSPNPILSQIQWRCKYRNVLKYIQENHIQIVFIRYIHFANPFFIRFLKSLKQRNIKVLLEIPTYPYDQEYQQLKLTSKLVLLIEKFSRRKFKKYVTRILTVTPYKTIFDVPTIEISNGIDPHSIKIVEKNKTNEEIHLIGVASMAHWHGYDRVIEGFHNYYSKSTNNQKIYFHLVGDNDNSETLRYKELVKKYDLSKYIIFYGRKSGKDLDLIFDKADMAVGSLGCHRINIKDVKSLKNREYCARGLPFFYSEKDAEFEGKNFVYRIPADESPVDIKQIIEFYSAHNFDKFEIRKYAVDNLSWEKQYERVMKELYADV
ncbi:MAG TPA: glycosyltransferase [Hanamia sp.]|nr:glycosyltransferase [Hanamia sp.]